MSALMVVKKHKEVIPMGKYFQPEIETASREEILAIQNEKIVRQVKNVYENVKYYRDLMDEKGIKPEDIKGVEDI